MKKLLALPVLTGILVIILTSCSTTPNLSDSTRTSPHSTQESDLKQLLVDAERSPSPTREALLIEAVKLLKTAGQLAQTKYILSTITPAGLPPDIYGEYLLIAAPLAIEERDYPAATAILESEETQAQLPYLSAIQRYQINSLRADLLAINGDHIESVKLRAELLKSISDSQAREPHYTALWHSLLYVPTTDLKQLSQTKDALLKGWYSLAELTKSYSDIDQQLFHLNRWLEEWPDHPAQERLPKRLKLLKSLAANRPQKVVLFLPLTGNLKQAGLSILEGFFSAYYQSLSLGNPIPEVIVVDTSTTRDEDFLALYNHNIVVNDAEFAIGPLAKNKVEILLNETQLPVPTLALNYVNTNTSPPAELYQFGLAVEDEVIEMVKRARLESYEQALILTPDSRWGNRVALSLFDGWSQAEGQVIAMNSFTGENDYSNTIQSALNVLESKQRAKRIQRLAKQPIEFTPRRRQDIDVIFLAANPEQARQIKPTLAFHFGGDIPVLATSSVFSGAAKPEKDQDLDDIVFPDIPWSFEQTNIKQKIEQISNVPPAFHRLAALGIDAFRLIPRIKQLELIADTKLYGKTGNLKLLPNRIIQRELIWGKFSRGTATQIPTLTSNDVPANI